MQSTKNSTGISEDVPARELTDMGITSSLIEREKELGFPKLDPQERAFAIEYINNGYDHCSAADKVGRSRNAGRKLLANPLVAAFIKNLQDSIWQESIITHHFIEMKYMELLDMAMGETEIRVITKDGVFEERITDISNAVKIVDKMSVMNGHSEIPDKKGSGGVTVRIDMNAWLGSQPPEEERVGITIDMEALESNE